MEGSETVNKFLLYHQNPGYLIAVGSKGTITIIEVSNNDQVFRRPALPEDGFSEIFNIVKASGVKGGTPHEYALITNKQELLFCAISHNKRGGGPMKFKIALSPRDKTPITGEIHAYLDSPTPGSFQFLSSEGLFSVTNRGTDQQAI